VYIVDRPNYNHPRFDNCVKLRQYPFAYVPGRCVYWIIEDGRGRFAIRDSAPGSNGNEPQYDPELMIYEIGLTWHQARRLVLKIPGCIYGRAPGEALEYTYAIKT
jgi:hypothetical protein